MRLWRDFLGIVEIPLKMELAYYVTLGVVVLIVVIAAWVIVKRSK